jgi:hypothetical protein
VPNRFTRVPSGDVPRLPAPVRLLVPIGDLFMIVMLSRPATGSLRSTWVTPATRWLSVAMSVIAVVALLLLRPSPRWLAVVEVVALAAVLAGAAAVAVIAFTQRPQRRAR